jgi:hypothetical protein
MTIFGGHFAKLLLNMHFTGPAWQIYKLIDKLIFRYTRKQLINGGYANFCQHEAAISIREG